jgi:hypothetical protein
MARFVCTIVAFPVALVAMFFAGVGSLYVLYEWVGFGDIAAMVVTVPAATAVGVGTWLLVARLPDLFGRSTS